MIRIESLISPDRLCLVFTDDTFEALDLTQLFQAARSWQLQNNSTWKPPTKSNLVYFCIFPEKPENTRLIFFPGVGFVPPLVFLAIPSD